MSKPLDFYDWAWDAKGMHPMYWGYQCMLSDYGERLTRYLKKEYAIYASSFDDSPPLNEDK